MVWCGRYNGRGVLCYVGRGEAGSARCFLACRVDGRAIGSGSNARERSAKVHRDKSDTPRIALVRRFYGHGASEHRPQRRRQSRSRLRQLRYAYPWAASRRNRGLCPNGRRSCGRRLRHRCQRQPDNYFWEYVESKHRRQTPGRGICLPKKPRHRLRYAVISGVRYPAAHSARRFSF